MTIRWDGNCFIANDDLPVFTRDFLPELESVYQIQKIGYVPEKYLPDEAAFRVYLDLPQQNLITCDLVADYGNDQVYHVFDGSNRQKTVIEICGKKQKLLHSSPVIVMPSMIEPAIQ